MANTCKNSPEHHPRAKEPPPPLTLPAIAQLLRTHHCFGIHWDPATALCSSHPWALPP